MPRNAPIPIEAMAAPSRGPSAAKPTVRKGMVKPVPTPAEMRHTVVVNVVCLSSAVLRSVLKPSRSRGGSCCGDVSRDVAVSRIDMARIAEKVARVAARMSGAEGLVRSLMEAASTRLRSSMPVVARNCQVFATVRSSLGTMLGSNACDAVL